MGHKASITFNLTADEKETLYSLAADLGFVNPSSAGNYAGKPSPLRMLRALIVAHDADPGRVVGKLRDLGLADPLPADPPFWKSPQQEAN